MPASARAKVPKPAYHEITIKIRVPAEAGEEIGMTPFTVPLLHRLRILLAAHMQQAYQEFKRSGPEMEPVITYNGATLTWSRDLVAEDGTVLDHYSPGDRRD